jgi:phage repressor protein C with HTH and peptisase S24 domain
VQIDPTRVRARLEALGLKARTVSIRVAGTPDLVRHILAGNQRETSGQRSKRLAQELQCSVEYLYGEADDIGQPPTDANRVTLASPETVDVPEFDVRLSAGAGVLADKEKVRHVWQVPQAFLDQIGVHEGGAAFVAVAGDSMAPRLMNGDLVLLDRRAVRIKAGAIYALWDGDALVCKRVEVLGDVLKLISDNAVYPTYQVPASGAHIIGRVVWCGRQV